MKRERRSLLIVASILIIFGVLLTASLNAGAISKQLHAWKVLPEPERLTELYFENHAKLPATYVPGTAQSFSFTVHNLEYANQNYSFSVTQQDESGATVRTFGQSSFTLAQDKHKTANVTVIPQDMGIRSKISVILTFREPNKTTDSQQTIDYWVTKVGV